MSGSNGPSSAPPASGMAHFSPVKSRSTNEPCDVLVPRNSSVPDLWRGYQPSASARHGLFRSLRGRARAPSLRERSSTDHGTPTRLQSPQDGRSARGPSIPLRRGLNGCSRHWGFGLAAWSGWGLETSLPARHNGTVRKASCRSSWAILTAVALIAILAQKVGDMAQKGSWALWDCWRDARPHQSPLVGTVRARTAISSTRSGQSCQPFAALERWTDADVRLRSRAYIRPIFER